MIFGSKSPHRPPTPVAASASPRCRIQPGELEFFTSHTNPNAATNDRTRGTVFQSTGEGRRGRCPLCRRYSTRVRRCRIICPLCGATSRRAGSGCPDQMASGSSLHRVLGPKQLTIWQRHSRRWNSVFRRIADFESERGPRARSIPRRR